MKFQRVNRVFAALLLMLFLAGLMPADVSAAAPTALYVNGEDILTAQDNTVVCGNGQAVYDSSANTLTLTNAEITKSYSSGPCIDADGDLKIILDGTNTISPEREWAGIRAENGSISIEGAGSLNLVTSSSFGIWADNDVSISADVSRLYVSAATQALRSEQGGSITIGDEPFTGQDKEITIENGQILSPLIELTVAGQDILTALNHTVTCGSGEAVYDPSTNTLTLDNAQIDYQDNGDDNSKGAILYDGDLNIHLIGDNYITSACGGIYSNDRGTLTITGDKLTIDSVYYGIGKINQEGNITVDGAELDFTVSTQGSFEGNGIHAGGVLSIVNGAYVDATEITNSPLTGNGGIVISDSTVYAHVGKDNYSCAIQSDKDVKISNSVVDAKTISTSGAVTIWAGGDSDSIIISDNSEVTISAAAGNAAYAYTGNIVITDSKVTATVTANSPVLAAGCDFTISNGTVYTESGGSVGLYAVQDLRIEGSSDVTASGGVRIGAAGSFTLVPPDGNLLDVWVGNSKDEASLYSGAPLSAETVITDVSSYLYFHSVLHTHVYDQEVVSDAYKAGDATCTEPASYYKSCICSESGAASGAETFTSGTAAGHSYQDGRCTVCGDVDPGFTPVITAGANGKWQKGSSDGLSFTSSAAFADFLKVQVDGQDLDAADYEVREGSTIVTLKASWLEAISTGTHTLAVVSSTGTAATEFTVEAASGGGGTGSSHSGGSSGSTSASGSGNSVTASIDTPATGDDSVSALWIAVMLTAGAVLAGTSVYTWKKKRRR